MLLERIAGQSEQALGELYDRTSPVVYGLVLRMVRDQSAAEDITQEVYLQAWRAARAFDPAAGAVLRWLVAIARNRARQWLDDFGAQAADPMQGREWDCDPARGPRQCEHLERVRRAVAELPADQRRVIELAIFDGLTHSEIASRTGLASGVIKTRLRSGMTELRRPRGLAARLRTAGCER